MKSLLNEQLMSACYVEQFVMEACSKNSSFISYAI